MNIQDFQITPDGLLNLNTNTFLSQDKFQTKKGSWSKRLLKSLGRMDNNDLNQFSQVYSRVYGGREVTAKTLVEIIPNFKNQKVNVYSDGKFYKARTFKQSKYAITGGNTFEKFNDNTPNNTPFVSNLIEDLKQLNLGTKLEIKVDLKSISQKKIFQLSASYVLVGEGSDAQYSLGANISQEMIIKVVEYGETYANSSQPMGVVGGEFFRFHCVIPNLDLKYLGIFSVNEINSAYHTYLNDNCLFWALKECGIEQDKLELLKTFVVNRNVPMSKLNIVCEKLGIQIKLRRLKGKKNKRT
mgnify:CR=1 FL=1